MSKVLSVRISNESYKKLNDLNVDKTELINKLLLQYFKKYDYEQMLQEIDHRL